MASWTSTSPLRTSSSTIRAWRSASCRRSGPAAKGERPTAVRRSRRAATRWAAAIVAPRRVVGPARGQQRPDDAVLLQRGRAGELLGDGGNDPARAIGLLGAQADRAVDERRSRGRPASASSMAASAPGALAQRAHQRAAAAGLGLVALEGERRQRHQRRQAHDVTGRGHRLAAVGERNHRAQRLSPGADRRLGGQRLRHPGRAVDEAVGHIAPDLGQAPVGGARRDRPRTPGREPRWPPSRPRRRPPGGRSRPARRRPRRPRPCARAGRPAALRAASREAQGWEPKATCDGGSCQPTLCAR